MDDLAHKVRAISQDLAAVQHVFTQAAMNRLTPEEEQQLEEVMSTELIHEFKAAVDHMRQFLWSYIEAANTASGIDRSKVAQTLRIKRATELIEMLRPTISLPEVMQKPETISFLSVVQQLTDEAVFRHMNRPGSDTARG